jgi:hypothetical protein
MIALLILAILAPPGDSPAWFALRMDGVDSSLLFAHDARSGVIVQCSSSASADPSHTLDDLRRSPRLLARRTGQDGAYGWELLELADPAAFARKLAGDIGRVPPVGSWEAAWVEAYTPPAECDRELQYFVTKGDAAPVVLSAIPCSADQRARAMSLVEAFMSDALPEVTAERRPLGPPALSRPPTCRGSIPGPRSRRYSAGLASQRMCGPTFLMASR